MEKLSYYILTPSTDAKLIGNYPQIIDFVTEENISSNISVEEFANYKGKFCEFNPNLNTFILHGQSKFTNMYSCSLCPGGDLLIDNDFNEILKKAKKGPVQIFNSK